MLTAQRANMNHLGTLEHHYQDPDQPFGFIFGTSDEPAPAPEAPAAGEPLLNDFELSSSNQFFDRFQNDAGPFDDPKLFESFDPFPNEPLFNFQGVSSSLNHPLFDSNSPVQTLDFTSFGASDLSSRFNQAHLTSPITGEHPGAHGLSHFSRPSYQSFSTHTPKSHRSPSEVFSTQSLFPSPKPPKSRTSFGPHSAHVARQDSLSSVLSRHSSINYDKAEANDDNLRRRQIPEVNFGFDADFSGRKYAAPGANLKDLQTREAMIQANLETFETKWDVDAETNGNAANVKRRLSGSQNADQWRGYAIGYDVDEDEEDEKPAKKARKAHDDQDDESSEDDAPAPTGKTKPKSKSRALSDAANGTNGRRKSALGEAKIARQNLTEEEKKMNHIRSEQKRRNQIKEGFADLTVMMPDSSAGASKCAILSQAVDWLSGLIEGNAQLRAQLEGMTRG